MGIAKKLREEAEKKVQQQQSGDSCVLPIKNIQRSITQNSDMGNSSPHNVTGLPSLPVTTDTLLSSKKEKQISFSDFKTNNWVHSNAVKNLTIKILHAKEGAFWMLPDGSFCFRRSPTDTIQELAQTKMKTVLCNFLDRENIVIFQGKKDEDVDIKRNEILMCEDKFNPFVDSEFYTKEDIWYRTAFKPTKYLQMTTSSNTYPAPSRILWLILHLCDGNKDYYDWVVNWLAYFFQTLKKSQVSLVLKGDQGTGKGIFFELISKLFGKEFCVVVDDDRLGSNFKNWISDKLFFNLNEIAHDISKRKSTKNFIKMLVTDPSIQTEKKYENAGETEIFGNVLITSNENYPLEIEPSDRRFSVFSTGASLKKIGVNTSELIFTIENEIEAFAYYLKSYTCDEALYHTALDTPEKRAMIEGTTDRFTLFAVALTEKNLTYFDLLEDENLTLFERLKSDFEKNRIRQSSIKPIFDALFDESISSKTLLSKLRAVRPMIFPSDRKMMKKSNGEYYYSL